MAQHKKQYDTVEVDTPAQLKAALNTLGQQKWDLVGLTSHGGKLVAVVSRLWAPGTPPMTPIE